MTAAELDGFLRAQLALLEAQRPGSARAPFATRWEEARAALVSAVTEATGLPDSFVLELLKRREAVRAPTHHNPKALAETADALFVGAITAAAAWTMAAAAAPQTPETAGRPRRARGK